MPSERFKNERGSSEDKKCDDWRFTGDPKEYSKYKDRVAYDLKKLDTNHLPKFQAKVPLPDEYIAHYTMIRHRGSDMNDVIQP